MSVPQNYTAVVLGGNLHKWCHMVMWWQQCCTNAVTMLYRSAVAALCKKFSPVPHKNAAQCRVEIQWRHQEEMEWWHHCIMWQ